MNATHAIADCHLPESGERGRIELRTSRTDTHAVIEVADNGAGIPAQVLPRTFEPFFTTKEVGKGTGQGLASAHSVIVKKHGGTIEARSVPGQGTVFTIRLPLS